MKAAEGVRAAEGPMGDRGWGRPPRGRVRLRGRPEARPLPREGAAVTPLQLRMGRGCTRTRAVAVAAAAAGTATAEATGEAMKAPKLHASVPASVEARQRRQC